MTEIGIVQYFVCGGFGGFCNVVVGHPLDTIKVRMQTMPTPKPGEKPLYAGTLDCLKTSIKNEGVLGLYKGVTAPLISIAPIFALSFLGYGVGKKIFGPSDGSECSPVQCGLAGSFSGTATSIIMSPGERIKCLLQTQQGSKDQKYKGSVDAAVKLYKEGGIKSIYRGLGATLFRDVPAAGAYFVTYEVVKDFFTDGGKTDPTLLVSVFAGGMAGINNWLAGMPQDVIKSKLQIAPEGTYPGGMRQVIAEIIKTDGFGGFYKGLPAVLLRSFPANAATFFGFELCRQFLNKWT